jgi:hypothetical protein
LPHVRGKLRVIALVRSALQESDSGINLITETVLPFSEAARRLLEDRAAGLVVDPAAQGGVILDPAHTRVCGTQMMVHCNE